MIQPTRKSKQFFDKKDTGKNEDLGRGKKKNQTKEPHESSAPEKADRRKVRKNKTKK